MTRSDGQEGQGHERLRTKWVKTKKVVFEIFCVKNGEATIDPMNRAGIENGL